MSELMRMAEFFVAAYRNPDGSIEYGGRSLHRALCEYNARQSEKYGVGGQRYVYRLHVRLKESTNA